MNMNDRITIEKVVVYTHLGEQFTFLNGRGYVNYEKKQDIFIAFRDNVKSTIVYRYTEYKISEWNQLKNIYENSKSSVRVGREESGLFSAQLFKFYMHRVLKKVNGNQEEYCFENQWGGVLLGIEQITMAWQLT